jgi:hypothetical protein
MTLDRTGIEGPALASVLVAGGFQTTPHLVEGDAVSYADGDIKDRLGGEPGYGGASHMLDTVDEFVHRRTQDRLLTFLL